MRWLDFQGDLISEVTQLTGLISCTLLLYVGLSQGALNSEVAVFPRGNTGFNKQS